MRNGWGQSKRKPSCFECGNTDRFKARCHIRIANKKRWTITNQTSKTKGVGGRKEVKIELERMGVNQLRFLSYKQLQTAR